MVRGAGKKKSEERAAGEKGETHPFNDDEAGMDKDCDDSESTGSRLGRYLYVDCKSVGKWNCN